MTPYFNAIQSSVSKSTCSTEFSVNFIRVDDVFDSLVIKQRKQDLIKSWISLTLHKAKTRYDIYIYTFCCQKSEKCRRAVIQIKLRKIDRRAMNIITCS